MKFSECIVPVVRVVVNGVEVGSAVIEDFFNKYGNCDGDNIIGLVAEAHLVRKLRKAGYNVIFVFSHNIEIRKIEKD